MIKEMRCKHRHTALRRVAWASKDRLGRQQGFDYRECCADCGAEINQRPHLR